jgi:2-polyprenyl-3-methyl-5-hydroxy-6-metoxy-1,4-benzoquinol methylase
MNALQVETVNEWQSGTNGSHGEIVKPVTCRFCGERLRHTFIDLGVSPLANRYLKPLQLPEMEPFYPLHAYVCGSCLLVQLQEVETPDHIFSDYAYFSSYVDTLVTQARDYTDRMVRRFSLNEKSHVVEIASNDGYLLQFFVARGIPVLGIEPAANVAKAAIEKGIPTLVKFFGSETARSLVDQGSTADLVVGNNVLAHVPDLNDFVRGIEILLSRTGTVTVEFPHLVRLIEDNLFDTIYHEHFSYFTLHTVEKVFAKHGLKLFDVEQIPTHGGSLRIYAGHDDDPTKAPSERLLQLRAQEQSAGYDRLNRYLSFPEKVKQLKYQLLTFLIQAKREGKSIAAYGAAAKGNTLLNYCGVRSDFIDYVVDRSPHKQGCFLPGTHIPILHPDKVIETKPDYLLILAWNLREEIISQMSSIREWNGKFVVPIPEVTVI